MENSGDKKKDIKKILRLLVKEYGFEEVNSEFLDMKKEDIKIPLSIYQNEKLGVLETTVKYLREELDFSYKEIASKINRNFGPIGVTYRKAFKKMKDRVDCTGKENIPIKIFIDKKNSILESIVSFLFEKKGYTYSQIARILNRDPRTIWTIYSRFRGKNER